jgi:hypothetical protein
MARARSSSFYWTTEEIFTNTGFYVGPAHPNPDADEISFLVLRIDDSRSSNLCKQIEKMSQSNGGIVIRGGSLGVDSAMFLGFSNAYHTNLFHNNCRCRLIIKPKALYGELDRLDFQMAAGSSAISYNQEFRARQNLESSVFEKSKNFEYKHQIQRIISYNLDGKGRR